MKVIFILIGLLDFVSWILILRKLKMTKVDLAAAKVQNTVTSMYLDVARNNLREARAKQK